MLQTAKNLGVVIDEHLTLADQVSSICKKAFIQIKNIYAIRNNLTKDATRTLVQAPVTSKLDYGNTLLYGLPSYQIKRLQQLQNMSARFIYKKRKFDISNDLHDLHWIPIAERIKFSYIVLVYKVLYPQEPSYLSSLVQWYAPSRILRSAIQYLLRETNVKTKTYGERAFSFLAPKLWNSLLITLRK